MGSHDVGLVISTSTRLVEVEDEISDLACVLFADGIFQVPTSLLINLVNLEPDGSQHRWLRLLWPGSIKHYP
jgi:hypothetical protein